MKKTDKIKPVSFPPYANTPELKINHLFSEAKKRKQQVLGIIDGTDVNVWPNDDPAEIISWFNAYNEHKKLEELLPNPKS